MKSLSQKFEWALIEKFSQGYNKESPKLGCPFVEEIQKYFAIFHGDFHIGLLDNHHLLIRFCQHEDYLRLYSKSAWYVRGLPIRIFKWSSSFYVDHESSIVLVWISLLRLPIYFLMPYS